jgi:23S rRNA pseudouridine2457 synthase
VDSEGLLLLTNDPHVIHRLTTPRFRHSRTYLVQVEGEPSETVLAGLRKGVALDGKTTLPAGVRRLAGEPDLPPRQVPIRARKTVPTSWLELTLHEGRNRQVRRMTARVGHPTLRLVRTAIGPLRLGSLHPGDTRPLTPHERAALFSALGPRPPSTETPEQQRPPGRPGGRSARSH